jgi:hypothetical protein
MSGVRITPAIKDTILFMVCIFNEDKFIKKFQKTIIQNTMWDCVIQGNDYVITSTTIQVTNKSTTTSTTTSITSKKS